MVFFYNILFWLTLHFGMGFLFPKLPENFKNKVFNKNKKMFIVSEKEIKFYKMIRLHKWKDKLPQFNRGFDKRTLPKKLSKEYIELFINVTCQAEAVHYILIPLGYISILFKNLTTSSQRWLFIFLLIATFIGCCNLVFSLIQRYNRFRFEKLLQKIVE